MNKTNNGKLLAAVIAMLMVACAVAVVAMPAEAEVDAKPTYDFTGDTTVEVDAVSDLTAEIGYDSKTGVLTVTKDLILDITGTVGSFTTPALKQIILNGGDLQITGTGVIYIGTDATQNNASVISFQQTSVLEITGAVDVNLNAAGTNCHILNNGSSAVTVLVTVSNGADLTITQTGSKGASWYNSDNNATSETYLDVDNATVNLTNAHSIQGAVVKATNGANINVNNERDVTGITLKDGSVIDNSKITVTKSGYSGVLVKGTIELNNSASIEVKESGVFGKDNKYPGINMSNMTWGNVAVTPAIVMDDTSSVKTTSIGVCDENSSEPLNNGKATITGGTFTGAFAQGNNSKAVSYTLNTTLAGTTSLAAGATIATGSYVTVTGTFTADDESTVSGTVFATSTAIVTVPSKTTPSNIVAVPGAEVTGVTISEDSEGKYTATTEPGLVAAAGVPGMEITISGVISLTADLTLADGVEVTVPVEDKDIYIDVSDADLNVVRGAAFNGRAVAFDDDGQKNVAVFSGVSGNYTISAGSVIINGDVTCKDGVITVSNDVVISGSLSGDLKVTANTNGDVIFKDFTVNAGATLDLGAKVTFSTEGKFNLYGSIIADAAVNLKVGTTSASEFTGYPGAVISQNVSLVVGNDDSKINLDDSLKNMEISVDITGDQVYSQMQNVTIVTSLDITPHASLTIMGQLVINEGVTLTIQENAELIISSDVAKMIVNGTIEVENGGTITVTKAESVTVTGTINSEGIVNINSKVTVEENGSILIDDAENSVLTVTQGLTVNAGGSVEVRGQIGDATNTTTIANKGTVTLNGAVLAGDVIVNMAANGAVVDIKSFTSNDAAKKLTITDDGLVLYDDRKDDSKDVTVGGSVAYETYTYPNANTIEISVPSGNTATKTGIRNLTVTEIVTSEKDDRDNTKFTYGMNLSGSVGVANEGDSKNPKYEVALIGINFNVAADTTLTLGAGVTLQVNDVAGDADGVLNVAGTIYAIAGGETNPAKVVNNKGVINVSGMIETLKSSEIAATINAAHYEADVEGVTHCYYTTLATAIANGAEEIYVMGDIKILENLTIPTGITVRADGAATIQVGDADHRDVVMTVTNGATVRGFTGGIDVFATLEFQNIKDSKSGNVIISDVQVDAEPVRTYTNIYTALNGAESGETVTITRTGSNVVLTDDIEVKAGVTLEIPNSKTVEIENGVTLTVNGTVKMIGEIVGQTGVVDAFNPMTDANTEKDADDYAVITVNGTLMSLDEIPYKTTVNGFGYYIPGAYYNIINTTGNYWYVTSVAQAAAVSNDVEDGEIEINGENTVADVAFTGDEQQDVTVTIMDGAKVSAGTITLSYAQIVFEQNATNGQFDGTIASAEGAVSFTNAKGFAVIANVDDDVAYIAVNGTPVQADEKGVDCTMTVVSGNVTVAANSTLNITDATLESFEIASGATMTVLGTIKAWDMTVDGTLVSTDGGNVDVDGILTVRGTFTVAAADETTGTDAGKADIAQMFVGIAASEKYIGQYVDTSAAVVTADNLGNITRILVSAESTITGDIIENMASTEFYVEDALWLTVYVSNSYYAQVGAEYIGEFVDVTNGSDYTYYGYQPGDLAESEFISWNDADGDAINATSSRNIQVGATGYEKVYAEINYDVYAVIVYIDNGIGDVAIDGQLLVPYDGGYVLPNYDLHAGQHTITYTLKPNFEGTPTLSTTGVNVTVSGLTFTLSGNFVDSNGYKNLNSLTLSGTTPADTTVVIEGGNGGSGDMGLTDYLLIILVVLIVIMAIMVAMRLMRS